MRVRRSTMSSTVSAPSWVTAYSNSARVTSIPSATGSVGLVAAGRRDDVGRLGTVAGHQRGRVARPATAVSQRDSTAHRPAAELRVRHAVAARPRNATARSRTSSCHVAVFGQLAADHADHAGGRFDDGMLARHVSGAASHRCRSAVAAPRRTRSRRSASSATSSAVLTVSSRKRHLRRRGFRHVGNRAWRILVGESEVHPAELFGHGEHEAVELPGYRNGQRRSRDCRTPRRRTPGGFRGWAATGSTSPPRPPTRRWR